MALVRAKYRNTSFAVCRVVVASSVLWIALVENAWAYLDPGTGWMIIQGFVAAIAAVGVAGRMYWSKLKEWFSPRSKAPPEEPPPGSPGAINDK